MILEAQALAALPTCASKSRRADVRCRVTRGCGGSFAENDYLGKRERIRMRNRELRRTAADLGKAASGAAVQPKLRGTAGLADHFDIAPEHSLGVSCSKRFHCRFLGRKTTRKVNRWLVTAHAVLDFGIRKDPMREAVAVAFKCGGDPRDVRRVESKANDGHAPTA